MAAPTFLMPSGFGRTNENRLDRLGNGGASAESVNLSKIG